MTDQTKGKPGARFILQGIGNMAKKIAINGFGRIGRLVLRNLMELGDTSDGEDVEVVAVNDISDLDNLIYLLKHDSIQNRPQGDIRREKDRILWNGREIRFLSEKDPALLPWQQLGVETVVECSGRFTNREGANLHLEAGAKRVVVSAPSKGADITVCMGLTHNLIDRDKHQIISNASCTTNCLAPIAKILNDTFEIEYGLLNTIHAVTASQKVVDGASKKWRRGRSALLNIVPTSTGAAKATGEVLPELKGKLDGMAMRVPVATGSVVDFVVQTKKEISVERINQALQEAAAAPPYQDILLASDEELVSSDIIGSNYSSIVDLSSTMVLGNHLAKVLAWYDNEWGYARRTAELAAYL